MQMLIGFGLNLFNNINDHIWNVVNFWAILLLQVLHSCCTRLKALLSHPAKLKLALVGTGHRGSDSGEVICKSFNEVIEFVGLCDINPGRMAYVKQAMNVNCPAYTDFKMLKGQTGLCGRNNGERSS